jgi:hypothetical protein
MARLNAVARSIVGRDQEMDVLLQEFERAERGRGRLVAIAGEAWERRRSSKLSCATSMRAARSSASAGAAARSCPGAKRICRCSRRSTACSGMRASAGCHTHTTRSTSESWASSRGPGPRRRCGRILSRRHRGRRASEGAVAGAAGGARVCELPRGAESSGRSPHGARSRPRPADRRARDARRGRRAGAPRHSGVRTRRRFQRRAR